MNITESTAKPISSILTSAFYKIPKFQRRYVWSQKEILQLLKDIDENPQDYFIGSMVAYKIDNEGTEKGIVDGQQRLTTITIILCALREIFKDRNLQDSAIGINDNYIQSKDRENIQRFKLDTETSRPYFQNKILAFQQQFDETIKPNSEEEETLEKAYHIIKRYFNKKCSETIDAENYLKTYRDKILSLKIVYIELQNKNDAYIIFDTLNDRGKSLDLSDKIKSYLFRILKTGHADVNRHSDYWNDIQEKINSVYENINIDDYIRYQWISQNGYATEPHVYEKLKIKIKETDTNGAEKYLRTLKDDLEYFLFINNPNKHITFVPADNLSQIRNPLLALNLFKIKQTTPVLIALMRAYNQRKITVKNLKNFLNYIESFHFQFNALTSGRPSVFQHLYFNLAKDLSDESRGDKNTLFNNFNFDKKKMPTDDSLINGFKNKIFTNANTSDKKLVQYILQKFDKHFRNDGTVLDYNQMTIEHLIPQSKISTYGQDIIGQLGNLILINSQLQGRLDNKSLKEKIAILEENNFNVYLFDKRKIKDNDEQNIKLITERTDKMAECAFESIWKL